MLISSLRIAAPLTVLASEYLGQETALEELRFVIQIPRIHYYEVLGYTGTTGSSCEGAAYLTARSGSSVELSRRDLRPLASSYLVGSHQRTIAGLRLAHKAITGARELTCTHNRGVEAWDYNRGAKKMGVC